MTWPGGSSRAPGPEDDRGVGELVFDVSERVSSLVREEFELAKTEVTEKITKLLKGSAVGAAAGVFAFLGLILLMHAPVTMSKSGSAHGRANGRRVSGSLEGDPECLTFPSGSACPRRSCSRFSFRPC